MGLLAAEDIAGLPVGSPPAWNTQPAPVFADEAVAQNYELSQHVSGADSYAVAGASVALPTGVTLVGSQLQYNGLGADGTTAGILIDAVNSFGTTISSSLSITINPSPVFTTFPVFDFYKAVVEMRGGTVVPASNTRFWEKPVYPTVADTTETSLLDLEAAVNAAAPGDVIFLQAGSYANQDIVITSSGTALNPITIAAATAGACDLANARIQVTGSFVNLYGFVSAYYHVDGSDNVVAYGFRSWPEGYDFISDGNRNRFCYNTVADRATDNQYWNIIGPTVAHCRVDHNHFLQHLGGPAPGGASEHGRIGSDDLGVFHYLYYDSNYGDLHLNDGGGNKTVSGENEVVALRSDRNMVVNNVFSGCNSHISIRAGRECTVWANWIIGGAGSHAAYNAAGFASGGIFAGGRDNLIGANYIKNTNANDLATESAIDFGGGDPGDTSREAADNNEFCFNTCWHTTRCVIVNSLLLPTTPDGIEFHNNACREETARDILWGDDGTNPVWGANVFGPNKGVADADVVEAIPDLENDSGYRVPIAAGNCDATGDDVSVMGPLVQAISAAGALYDIVGQAIPTTNPDIGALQGGAVVSTDPIDYIYDNSGAGYTVSRLRTGIFKELTLRDTTFGPMSDAVDGIVLQTWDSSVASPNQPYISRSAGGTWDPNWNTTRVNLFTEEGVSGPVTDDALRLRLEYDVPYTDSQNAPRDKLFWGNDDFGGDGYLSNDVEYWFGGYIFLPADYENDGEFGRETLFQLHNGATAPGDLAWSIDGGEWSFRERLSDTDTISALERTHVSQSVNSDKGKITYWIVNFRMNPFSVQTTIDSGMGNDAQVGVTYPANTGRLRIWKTLDPGAVCDSDTFGQVTNDTAVRQEFLVTDIQDAPVGRVPTWDQGIPGNEPYLTEWGLYKGNWFNKEDFVNRPAIPHASSTKAGPITLYFGDFRLGDSTSGYSDVHPLQSPMPGQRNLYYRAEFHSGEVLARASAVDGVGIFCLREPQVGTAISVITDGGAGPATDFDVRVMDSEVEPTNGNGAGVTVLPRLGNYYLRAAIYLTKDYTGWGSSGSDNPRCEMFGEPADDFSSQRTDYDTRTFYGVSIYLPTNHETESPARRNMLCSVSSSGASATHMSFGYDYPEGGTGSGNWALRIWTSDSSITEGGASVENINLGSYAGDLGKWTDFVFEFQFNPFTVSTNASTISGGRNQVYPGNTGYLRIWKTDGVADINGNRVFTEITTGSLPRINVPIGLVPDALFNVTWRWRQYKPSWKNLSTSVDGPVYIGFDCFYQGEKVRDGTTFADVNPGQLPEPAGARQIDGRLTWETGQVQSNGFQDGAGIYTDGFRVQVMYEDGAHRTISNVTNSTTPVATYSGTLVREGMGLTFAEQGGIPEMNGRLFRVGPNPTASSFEVWQDGDDTGWTPDHILYVVGDPLGENVRTDTSGYSPFGFVTNAQSWSAVNTGSGNPTLPLDADVKVVQTGHQPPSNKNGSAALVTPLRGDHFLSSYIWYWHDYSGNLDEFGDNQMGNDGKNKPRFTSTISGGQEFLYGEEQWFSISFFLPSNYHHSQRHGNTSRNQLLYLDELPSQSGDNPIELHLQGADGAGDVWNFDATNGGQEFLLVPVTPDVGLWTTFIFRIKGHATNGILEIWKSTGPVIGPNPHERADVKIWSQIGGQVGHAGVTSYLWNPRQYKFSWHAWPNTVESTKIWIGYDEIRYGLASNGTRFVDVHPFQHQEPA